MMDSTNILSTCQVVFQQVQDNHIKLLLQNRINFAVKLRDPHQFEQEIRDFISSESAIEMTNLFKLISLYGVTILTTISNVIASSHPELALEILQKETSIIDSRSVSYAVEDFQLEPSSDLGNSSFLWTDFIPDLC